MGTRRCSADQAAALLFRTDLRGGRGGSHRDAGEATATRPAVRCAQADCWTTRSGHGIQFHGPTTAFLAIMTRLIIKGVVDTPGVHLEEFARRGRPAGLLEARGTRLSGKETIEELS